MPEKIGRKRRSWDEAFKRQVVEEVSQPGVSTAEVARRYGLNANLIFNWKRRFGDETADFLPVEVTAPEPVAAEDPEADGVIHIMLPRGIRMEVAGDYDPVALGRLLREASR